MWKCKYTFFKHLKQGYSAGSWSFNPLNHGLFYRVITYRGGMRCWPTNNPYWKVSSARVCIKIFLIKGRNQNHFCTRCPKSALRECKIKNLSWRHPQQNIRKSHEFSCLGRVKCFRLTGKKNHRKEGRKATPPFIREKSLDWRRWRI